VDISPGTVLLIITGGILTVEGAIWAIAPTAARKMYEDAFRQGDRALHIMGLVSVALGVACLAFALR
jgi:uncharacterized protein YjeT (DUF2065 family)